MPEHDLTERLAATRTRIASAATRAGRSPKSVGLVAISKGHPAAAIRSLSELGQRDFGENYLQEALPKLEELRDLPITWHFTGQVQANKTRQIAESFAWVHTLDRERTATRLNDQRPPGLPPINVCLQVRLEDEPGKGGVEPTQIADLAARVCELSRLKLRGLMAIPPPRDSFEEQKHLFERVAALLRDLQAGGFDVDTLSLGMSGDLEAAIAAGATQVRIGTSLFGERRRA
jgi:PLP dependent protein